MRRRCHSLKLSLHNARAPTTRWTLFFLFSVLELATCANFSLLSERRGEQRVSSNGRIREDRAAHLLDAGE